MAVTSGPRRSRERPHDQRPVGLELVVDRIACDGFGMCAELLPELIDLDEWGYPIVAAGGVPAFLVDHARRAVAVCPVLALRLAASPATSAVRGSAGWHGNRPASVRR